MLPTIPSLRHRIWIALGCVVFLYYTRFWLAAMYSDQLVAEANRQGTEFFDFFVPWVQFVPLLFALAITLPARFRRGRAVFDC